MIVRSFDNTKYQLTQDEIILLGIVNNYSFVLPTKNICFDELLKSGVEVFLDGKDFLQNNIECSQWNSNDPFFSGYTINGTIEQRNRQILSILAELGDVKGQVQESLDRIKDKIANAKFDNGYYVDVLPLKGSFQSSKKRVTLYLENMNQEKRLSDVVYVYIHEMFHAYYSSCFSYQGDNVREIEECITEFSTLVFLEEISSMFHNFKNVFEHAKNEVEGKRWSIGLNAAYGFGKYVFDNCNRKKELIAEYAKNSCLFCKSMPDVADFIGRVYPFYPIHERDCFELLERLLFNVNAKTSVLFEHYHDFNDVALRILLVDDKVCGIKDSGCENPIYKSIDNVKLEIKKCTSDKKCAKAQCKLCTIKRLMDNGEKKDAKDLVFKGIKSHIDYFYWNEKNIDCYYCPTVVKDFISDDNVQNNKEKIHVYSYAKNEAADNSSFSYNVDCDFPLEIDNNNVQIIGVRDVRTALLLLSKYKFDMLFFDYLLDKKDDNCNEREYSIQFFEFLSTDYEEKAKKEHVEEKRKKYRMLADLKQKVLVNRGPLDKLWIMPITGFNSPFIQNLQNKNVPLISTRWHIENGADPITTPWQFLVKLNQFIELQLKGCVYNMEQLVAFLTCSGANLEKIYQRQSGKPTCRFHNFQAFMGAELSNFISRYGSCPVIRRDALTESEKNDLKFKYAKSLFSTYVWNTFYTTKDEEKRKQKLQLFKFHNLLQFFYQVAATMPEDRNGVKHLREKFRRLRFFIDKNNLYIKKNSNVVDEERKRALEHSMEYIADSIDVLLTE